jgi:hypothetical protein
MLGPSGGVQFRRIGLGHSAGVPAMVTQCDYGRQQPVGAGNAVTLCDLRILVDQAAEPAPAQNVHTGYFDRRMRAPGGRLLLQ